MTPAGSLCSGVGGLDLAVESFFGADTIWQAESDPHASTVLAARWGVPNLGDITTVDWTSVEPVDVLSFGFPCQDISSAGRGAGIIEGNRSGLWYACWGAVRVLRPRIVVVENVSALLARRPGFDVCAADMAADGYDFRWASVRASDVGAPHRRQRVFIVATDTRCTGTGRDGRRAPAPQEPDRRSQPGDADASGVHQGSAADTTHVGHERFGAARRRWTGSADSGATPPDTASQRRGRAIEPRSDVECDGLQPALMGARDWGRYEAAIRRWELTAGPAPHPLDDRGRLNPQLSEWMMGFPPGWVTDLLPRNPALKCLGNAVVPQQAVYALGLLDSRQLAEAS